MILVRLAMTCEAKCQAIKKTAYIKNKCSRNKNVRKMCGKTRTD